MKRTTLTLSSWGSWNQKPHAMWVPDTTNTNDWIMNALQKSPIIKSLNWNFISLVQNRNHIVFSEDEIQPILWKEYDNTKIYFVRFPELSSHEKQKLKINGGSFKLCIYFWEDKKFVLETHVWKLKYNFTVQLEKKNKK